MTPAGIEPATLRFVAQHLNHCATAVSSNLEEGGGGGDVFEAGKKKGGGALCCPAK